MAADFDGDGTDDVVYLKNKNSLRLIDSNDNGPRTINLARGKAKADTQKTLLAVGSWDGSPTSIFYTGQNHATIYRVAPGSSRGPVEVVTPSNGVSAVLGPGDVDGDGTAELAFVGGSQTVRYVEPGGGTKSTGVTAGSSNNVGAGAPTDFDGDGTASVPVVDGSNQILLVTASGVEERVITGSDDEQAAKSALTAADVDDDATAEIVYLENNNSPADLKHVDEVGGDNEFELLVDDEDRRIEADKKRGAA